MTSNYLSRWSKPNQPTPHRVTLRTLIPICQHLPKPIWPDWIRYKMLTLRNCANIIWCKVGCTGSVTFLTVSANHFHQINAQWQYPQFCCLVPHSHDFIRSVHMTLTAICLICPFWDAVWVNLLWSKFHADLTTGNRVLESFFKIWPMLP